jgi:predicted nucleotidyltransferase component of viral defense system
MLDIIKKQIDPRLGREEQINQAREFLQILILKIMYDLGAFKNLAFTGGTALRILYDLKRYSEDLDFSLIQKKDYSFMRFHKETEKQLIQNYGFKLTAKSSDQKIVQTMDLKFNELLFDLGLSDQKTQKLYIKIEVDSNPPAGWETALSLVSRSFVFTVMHFDLPSLYATKLHACFFRKYTKGRDLYDLIWYLGKDILPNFNVLNNAIEQTEHSKLGIDGANFRDFLLRHLEKINFPAAQKDVERFLIDKSELKLFDKGVIRQAVMSKFLA